MNTAYTPAPAGGISTILYKIRRNIRNEFAVQLVAYLVLLLLYLRTSGTGIPLFIISLSTLVLFMQGAYHLTRFVVLRRLPNKYDLLSESSIPRIRYELELHMEIYRTYIYAAAPWSILALIAIFNGEAVAEYLRHLLGGDVFVSFGHILPLLLLMLGLQLLIYSFFRWHITRISDRYLHELTKILDESEDQERCICDGSAIN